jgi:uncharacterized protein (TIGR03085 family)
LRQLGPDAPTLDEGWATRHLAAHLVVREWNPIAAAGIVMAPLAQLHDHAIDSALRTHRYGDLVDRVDAGPPLWWRPFDAVANLVEYVVHHEDVRRGGQAWEPRPEPDVEDVEAAVWRSLRWSGPLYGRRLHGTAVELRLPSSSAPARHGSRTAVRVGRGDRRVVVEGRPIELLLFMLGRQRAARISLDGPPDLVTTLSEARLGL